LNPNSPLTSVQINSDQACFKSSSLFYFDTSRNGFTLPNGFQNAYENKHYKLMITTYLPSLNISEKIIYSINVLFPIGNPLVILK
jgi:hypothetical protein